MPFENYSQLTDLLARSGVTRVIFKPLAENDNSKQQIYLGGSFEA
jgi:cobyrinic acid a,c-diamide synthase